MAAARWTRLLAEFLCEPDVVPQAVRSRAVLVFADTIAAMAAGAGEGEVARLIGQAAPSGPCTVVGRRAGFQPGRAAFVNAISGTAAELDEGNYAAGGHPAVHCVPAALACAEAMAASGAGFIAAVIAGYEGAARIGAATRLARAVHSHGTWGIVGAAIAVARLRGYRPDRLEQAILAAAGLCNASSRTSGFAGATIRHAFAGVAAAQGMLACDMVEAGFTGERDAPEIVFGTILGTRFDPEPACAGLGSVWYIERNFFKLAASCRETHGSLDAWAALCAANPSCAPAPEQIAGILVETFEPASLLAETAASTPLAARYSIPFVLAAHIVRGGCGPQDLRADAMADARLRALAQKIRVREDPGMTALLPSRRITSLTLTLIDGRTLTGRSDGSPGDAARPLSAEQHRQKFLLAAEVVWGHAAPSIHALCSQVPDLPAIDRLTHMFRSALAAGD